MHLTDGTQLRRRTVDGRGLADIRLMQMEDGPGRGQRLLVIRNGSGIGLEIALDRGFDLSSLTFGGINIGWNSANGLRWPPYSVDAEDGLGFYRNLDGFMFTCGLDHIGGPGLSDAGHYLHERRNQMFHPLHGRISSQQATLSGYGIDWNGDVPLIWAEGLVRQSAIFGENLILRRRVTLDVFAETIRIRDEVLNQGFRPTRHAILYHFNFGYPFLDETVRLLGDLDPRHTAGFNDEDKLPRDDYVDYFELIPVVTSGPSASVALVNEKLNGRGVKAQLNFLAEQLPDFGIWRAYQSGVYALALEPMRPFGASGDGPQAVVLQPGQRADYAVELSVAALR